MARMWKWTMGARGIKRPNGGYTMRCMACGKYEGWAVCEYMPNYCNQCYRHLDEIPPIDELPYFAERLKNRKKKQGGTI